MRFFVFEDYRFLGTHHYRTILIRTCATMEQAQKVLVDLYLNRRDEVKKLKATNNVKLKFFIMEEQPQYLASHNEDETE